MNLNRRELLKSTVAAALGSSASGALSSAQAAAPATETDWAAVREDFPWLKNHLWISGADYHPIGIHSVRAMEKYLAWRSQGPGEGFSPYGQREERETKEMFAKLINAKPSEIAFVQCTTEAENQVVAGMDLPHRKGNVVLDDLHYQASKYLYHMLEKESQIELRVVPHRSEGRWSIDPRDMEKAVDNNTLLVSVAWVSNINGYLHDIKATSDLAHAHGAYVYADIIQGAGAVPCDVQALGIDFAGCGAYKWLMGDFGFGFMYVREDLQDSVVKRSRWGVRQFTSPNRAQAGAQFVLIPGAARYETGAYYEMGGICAHAALQYILNLGIHNIRTYVKQMTDRLQKELPAMGYPPITPLDNPTPIVSFQLPDYDKTRAKLREAFGKTYVVALRRWEFSDKAGKVNIVNGMRISPSIYNNQEDIDRLLKALA